MTQPDDGFDAHVKRQVLDAYGFESEAELDAAIEQELPGYLAAEAEYTAERAAYVADLPGRVREVAAEVTGLMQAQGFLPDGVGFELEPMDLQADPLWVAPAPWARVEGQLLAGALESAGLLEGFVTSMRSACESVLALSRALRLEPWPHGWNEPCFCHPKPFPAARDYRRRTRHRNRRRR